MINITFPDGAVKEFQPGITGMEIAESISRGLAKRVLSIDVNGNVWDLTRPITEDAKIKLLSFDDEGGKYAFWHSSAHLMAEAIQEIYPDAKFTIGPPVDHGFYYDVDFGDRQLSVEELATLEKKMAELAKKNSPYQRRNVSKEEAAKYYSDRNNEFKVELINALNDGDITFYQQGNFVDLCRGPHLPHTGYIKAMKLLNIAGAYWRGDEKNKQLTRIYGITFPDQKLLDDYLAMLEEAKKRDHRRLGKELEIFIFDDDVGIGMPLWLPNGGFIIEKLEWLAKKTEEKAGYQRVRTPHLAKESMYLKSGHLPYYEESMFPAIECDGIKYYLKAMNCPHHHKIFGAIQHSYKDMPVRLAEYGTCYRFEKSGELFGLMRVRQLQMNDAHIYCTKDQFEEEFRAVNDMYLKYFKIFGIDKYVMRFSTHIKDKLGKKYVDEPELWIETENMVRQVLVNSGIPFVEVADEAAFYGPKIDVQIWSAIGREFTLATNQVDFAVPRRFGLTYTDENNQEQTPICIHRAPLGTHERFIGFLLEHYAGKLPVWIAPEQVRILPISDKFMDYAKEVLQNLKNQEIRCSIDERSEKIGKKIRDTEMKKIPYMLVVGEKEVKEKLIAVRKQGGGDKGAMDLDAFVNIIREEEKIVQF